jgi:hypothetical protein
MHGTVAAGGLGHRPRPAFSGLDALRAAIGLPVFALAARHNPAEIHHPSSISLITLFIMTLSLGVSDTA